MKKLTKLAVAGTLTLAAAFAVPGLNAAWAAGYLKMGDIKGESTDSQHKDWILIESMSSPIFHATQSTDQASGMASGKRQHKPFTITKELDKASPMLQEAATTGKVFETVIIDYTEADERGARATYLKYELKNVMITSYSVSGGTAGGDDRPMETFSLNYEEIKMTPAAADENRKNNRKDKSYSREKDKDR